MMNLGDFAPGAMIDFKWNTFGLNGQSITRATDGAIAVYKANSAIESSANITDTEDFDGLTGVHHCRIDTSLDGTFYAAGNDFDVVLTGAVVDGQTINVVLAHFSIGNRVVQGLASAVITAIQSGLATSSGVAAVAAKTDNLPSDPADQSLVIAATDAIMTRLGAPVGADLSADIAGVVEALFTTADGVESGLHLRAFCRLAAAALLGKSSGLDTGAPVFRDTNDTKDRITATAADGNRSAVTLDAS